MNPLTTIISTNFSHKISTLKMRQSFILKQEMDPMSVFL